MQRRLIVVLVASSVLMASCKEKTGSSVKTFVGLNADVDLGTSAPTFEALQIWFDASSIDSDGKDEVRERKDDKSLHVLPEGVLKQRVRGRPLKLLLSFLDQEDARLLSFDAAIKRKDTDALKKLLRLEVKDMSDIIEAIVHMYGDRMRAIVADRKSKGVTEPWTRNKFALLLAERETTEFVDDLAETFLEKALVGRQGIDKILASLSTESTNYYDSLVKKFIDGADGLKELEATIAVSREEIAALRKGLKDEGLYIANQQRASYKAKGSVGTFAQLLALASYAPDYGHKGPGKIFVANPVPNGGMPGGGQPNGAPMQHGYVPPPGPMPGQGAGGSPGSPDQGVPVSITGEDPGPFTIGGVPEGRSQGPAPDGAVASKPMPPGSGGGGGGDSVKPDGEQTPAPTTAPVPGGESSGDDVPPQQLPDRIQEREVSYQCPNDETIHIGRYPNCPGGGSFSDAAIPDSLGLDVPPSDLGSALALAGGAPMPLPPYPPNPLDCSPLVNRPNKDAYIECMRRGPTLNLSAQPGWNNGPAASLGVDPRLQSQGGMDPRLVNAALPTEDMSLVHIAHSVMQNQGQEGACTAFGFVHSLVASVKKVYPDYETSASAFWRSYSNPTMPDAASAAKRFDFQPDSGAGLSLAGGRTIVVTDIQPLKSLNDIKATIQKGNTAVWAASGVNNSWQAASKGGSSGILECGSQKGAGHSYSLVGYFDTPQAPGGGYIVIKNSWGRSWGFRGYGFLPYACVTGKDENFPLEAHAIKWCVKGEPGCVQRP